MIVLYYIIDVAGNAIFVDNGNLYSDGPLQIGELTLSKSIDQNTLHSKGKFIRSKLCSNVFIFASSKTRIGLKEQQSTS